MYRRIRDLRHDHDMTQRELAEILGMSQTGYSKYETGENDIPTIIKDIQRQHRLSAGSDGLQEEI